MENAKENVVFWKQGSFWATAAIIAIILCLVWAACDMWAEKKDAEKAKAVAEQKAADTEKRCPKVTAQSVVIYPQPVEVAQKKVKHHKFFKSKKVVAIKKEQAPAVPVAMTPKPAPMAIPPAQKTTSAPVVSAKRLLAGVDPNYGKTTAVVEPKAEPAPQVTVVVLQQPEPVRHDTVNVWNTCTHDYYGHSYCDNGSYQGSYSTSFVPTMVPTYVAPAQTVTVPHGYTNGVPAAPIGGGGNMRLPGGRSGT